MRAPAGKDPGLREPESGPQNAGCAQSKDFDTSRKKRLPYQSYCE